MSLTKQDISNVRAIMTDVVMSALNTVVNPRLDRIEAQLDNHSAILDNHSAILAEHGKILAEHGRRLAAIEQKVDNVNGRLEAIEADVKELYALIKTPTNPAIDKKFAKLSPEQKLRQLHAALLVLAEQLHVEL